MYRLNATGLLLAARTVQTVRLNMFTKQARGSPGFKSSKLPNLSDTQINLIKEINYVVISP